MALCEQKIMMNLINGVEITSCSCEHGHHSMTRNSLAGVKSEPDTSRITANDLQNLASGGSSTNVSKVTVRGRGESWLDATRLAQQLIDDVSSR